MSWFSRLLGEIPEETKYKPSSEFKVKTGEGNITLESTISSSHQHETETVGIDIFEKLQEEMEKIDKTENYGLNDVRATLRTDNVFSEQNQEEVMKTRKLAIKFAAIIAIVAIAGVFLSNSNFDIFPLFVLLYIFFQFFGKKTKGLSKSSK